MSERYFVDTPIRGGRATLTGPEAHHLIHVMRFGPGNQVVLFDGSGAEFAARIDRVGRAKVELTVLARREVNRESSREITLGVALPKGDRRRWLVEKAVELGVRRLVPLATSRSVARLSDGALARLRRTVVEASKQCGRNRLMEIAEPQAWSDFVVAAATGLRLLAHPEEPAPAGKLPVAPAGVAGVEPSEPPGKPAGGSLRLTASHPPKQLSEPAVLAVGPEGGFTPDEVALAASAGWKRVDLGPRILRVETAAILMVALVVQGALGGT